MSDLLRYKPHKYICFDGESENVNNGPGTNRPWQLAWSVVENGKVKSRFDKFPFIHDLRVSPDAAVVTRFNYDEYKRKSEDAKDVCELFSSYYYNPEYLIVGQNVYFDWMLVKNLERYVGIHDNKSSRLDVISRIYDTSALAKAYKLSLTFPKDLADFPAWQFSLCNYVKKGLKTNLKQLCSDFDVKEYSADKHHDAGMDVYFTYLVFEKLKWVLEIK